MSGLWRSFAIRLNVVSLNAKETLKHERKVAAAVDFKLWNLKRVNRESCKTIESFGDRLLSAIWLLKSNFHFQIVSSFGSKVKNTLKDIDLIMAAIKSLIWLMDFHFRYSA